MLRRPTFIFLVFSMAIYGMALSGCGGGGGSSNNPISVSLSPSAAQAIDQGQTINFTASVANDSASKGVSWSQTGGALSAQTTISATFTASGAAGSGSATATSVANASKSATVGITVTAVPALNVPALPSATKGSPYSQKVSATGGAGTLTYSIKSGSGALPAGLALSGDTISGTPTGPAGTSTFTLQVTDSSTAGAMSATQQLSITVAALSITTTALPNGSVSGAYSFVLASTGGVAPVTWSITSGTLPAGLTLIPATGAITGTATAAGTATITFQVADSSTPQQTAKATLGLTIAQLMITTTSLLNPMVGEAYNQSVLYTDSGGTLPVTWSLASGSSLPMGFSLDPSSGAITGTATSGEVGTTNFTVQVTDSSVPTPQTATQALSLTITTATACGSGSEALLNGQYAMSLTGFDASGPVGLLASFTANGAGHITSGYEDINSLAGVQPNLSVVPASSSYSLGSDQRGCLTLVTSSGTQVFRIAVGILQSGVATIGRSIEFDTTGTNVAGTIQIQYPNAFSNGAFQGSFAYTVQSPLNSAVGGGFSGSVGILNLTGSSVTGEGDMNINGTVDPGNTGYPATAMPFTGGTYSISGTGRGTLSFSVPVSGTPTTINLVLYVISTTQVYLMSSTPQSTTNGALNLFSGFAQQQSGTYNNGSLSTPSVLFTSGQTAAGGPASRVEAGVFTPDGNGNFTFAGDLNSGGTVSTVSSFPGTYTVDSSGRILITNSGGAGPAIIMYMGLPGYSYSLSTDANVMVGNAEPQTGTPFTNATLSGIFSFGTIVPVVAGSPLRAGEANYDGNGNLTITFDVNEGGFLSLDNVTTSTYAVSSNGRVVSPAGGTTLTVSYIKSTGTVISFGYTSTDTNPTLQVMDQ
jgi:Putative Ig domain